MKKDPAMKMKKGPAKMKKAPAKLTTAQKNYQLS